MVDLKPFDQKSILTHQIYKQIQFSYFKTDFFHGYILAMFLNSIPGNPNKNGSTAVIVSVDYQ